MSSAMIMQTVETVTQILKYAIQIHNQNVTQKV
jgi:hypothetical protein